ncbi:MAG: alginate O-acetyltransferase AlgX-related protein, partial [Aggregatilineales bacterium]
PLIDGHAEIVLDAPGGLLRQQTDPDISFEKVLENRRNTAAVILEAGYTAGYQTVDLWNAFDAAASEGEILYYTYDTHWNQAGHDLAGAQIAQFIESNC